MAKETSNEIAKKEGEKINKNAEINEAYFVGLLWADPFTNYNEYNDIIAQDEFIHDVWGFYYELGRRMYDDGVKKFDDITVHTKIKEYNIEDSFNEYGQMTPIDDAVSIVKDNIENTGYYYETIKKNYVIRQLFLLFGVKVFIDKGNYKWKEMSREQLTVFWNDKINKISLDNVNRYEAENLYIDADLFIKKLEEESADMMPFYNSFLLNSISQGVARGHVTMVGGFGGTGKALALNTPIPTPNGWTTMGELMVGDLVFGSDGKAAKVTYKSPVFEDHDVYEVTFDDGEKILADAEHQWSVKIDYSEKLSKRSVKRMKGKDIDKNGYFVTTTEEMKDDFVTIRQDRDKRYKYKIPMPDAVEYEEENLLISPYTLGFWLGDGTSSNGNITVGGKDLKETVTNIINDGYEVSVVESKPNVYTVLLKNPHGETHCERGHKKDDFWNPSHRKCRECDRIRHSSTENIAELIPKYYKSVVQQLREIDVLDNKHIPTKYLQSSTEQRYELLSGLMDSDGCIDENGYCEFSQSNERMVDNFSELLSSLGIKHSLKSRYTMCNNKKFKSYRVTFYADKNMNCFKLKRKNDNLMDNLSSKRNQKSIVNIKKVETVPTQCIAVDNSNHLYLAGKRMTVTHNTSIMAEKFVMSAIANQEKMIVVLNEESAQAFRQKIVLTILNHEYNTGIDRKRMVNGKLQEEDKVKIRKAFTRMKELIDGEESLIKIIFMDRYIIKDLEKIVRFWCNRGYINLLIDTHKVSDESQHEQRWQIFVEDMKTIYRWTRANAGGMNLRTVVTIQLADYAIKNRYLDFEAIGEGKAAKNEASVVSMFRVAWSDEYEGEKKELDCYRLRKNEKTGKFEKEHFTLEKGKTYYLWFTPKNRFGSDNDTGQPVLVIEPNFNFNNFKEVGWTFVANDKGNR